jgi:hypothetical protein
MAGTFRPLTMFEGIAAMPAVPFNTSGQAPERSRAIAGAMARQRAESAQCPADDRQWRVDRRHAIHSRDGYDRW